MCIGIDCLCEMCANNVDNIRAKTNECVEPCFHCEEECYAYDHDSHKRIRPISRCKNYLITDYHAILNRKKIKVM